MFHRYMIGILTSSFGKQDGWEEEEEEKEIFFFLLEKLFTVGNLTHAQN